MKKQILSIILAIVASVGSLSAEVFTGVCGLNLQYSLNTEDSVLTITGYGELNNNSCTYCNIFSESSYATYVKTVILPNGLTSIGGWAFIGCNNLIDITIPNTVISIGSNAFKGCTKLTSVVLPNSIREIWNSAFSGCYSLTSINIPPSVEYIDQGAFSGCNSLPIIDNVRFADTYLVEMVDKSATSCIIPENTRFIDRLAFRGCSQLTSIIMNAKSISMEEIGGIFSDVCKQITSFTFGENVDSIASYMCYNMSNLTTINIPASVTYIGKRVFDGCTSLTSITWNAKNIVEFQESYSPFNVIRSQIESFSFGEEVKTIPADLCYGMSNLTSITIPNSVTSIGDRAFALCTGVKSIVIPNSVISIGIGAFYGCGLNSVIIGTSVTSIGIDAFCGCTGLSEISIPASVTYLSGFSGCSGIKTVTIPNSVVSLGDRAFSNCTGITSVIIPESVTTIGNYAFNGCTGLDTLYIPASVEKVGSSIIGNNDNERAVIFKGIPAYCDFKPTNNTNLETIVAPAICFDIDETSWAAQNKQLKQVSVIGGYLTENALGVIHRSYKTLESLNISSISNTALTDESFKDFYNMTNLHLPANLESIGYMAVAGCVKLKEIDIPASVEEIDDRAFEDCRSLETITFGGKQSSGKPGLRLTVSESKLRRIGNWAFYNAHELQNLELPEGVEEIGDAAFYGCVYLENLVVPSSTRQIGDNTFALCSKLRQITVKAATPPQIQKKTFYDVHRQIPVYVPEDALTAYQEDPLWAEFNLIGSPNIDTKIDSLYDIDYLQPKKIIENGHIYILLPDGAKYSIIGTHIK